MGGHNTRRSIMQCLCGPVDPAVLALQHRQILVQQASGDGVWSCGARHSDKGGERGREETEEGSTIPRT